MSELRNALDAILRVNVSEPVSNTSAVRIATFLHRAAEEISVREDKVTAREAAVSQRESNASLKESELEERTKVVTAAGNLRQLLDFRPASVELRQRKFWRPR